MSQPTIAELTARFLARPSVNENIETIVEPHETHASFAVDAQSAWSEATAVFRVFGLNVRSTKSPTDWSTFVRLAADADYLPLALGHFPQQVRNISALLERRPSPIPTESRGWIAKGTSFVEQLLAAASARIAQNFAEAERILDQIASVDLNTDEQTIVANERATVLWSQGKREAAEAMWQTLPANAVVNFNRGVAALAAGRALEAMAHFELSIRELTETSGWHHLAQLYRALAEILSENSAYL